MSDVEPKTHSEPEASDSLTKWDVLMKQPASDSLENESRSSEIDEQKEQTTDSNREKLVERAKLYRKFGKIALCLSSLLIKLLDSIHSSHHCGKQNQFLRRQLGPRILV